MHYRLAALLVLVVLILALFAALVISSRPASDYGRKVEKHDDYCQTQGNPGQHHECKDRHSFFYKTADDPVAIFTAGLMVFTIALVAATVRLSQVTRDGVAEQAALTREALMHADRSARAAEAALEKGQSPYLYPAFKWDTEAVDGRNPPTAIVADFTNYGQSPAFIQSVDLRLVGGGQAHRIIVDFRSAQFDPSALIVREGKTECLTRIEIAQGSLPADGLASGQTIAGYIWYNDLTADGYVMAIRYAVVRRTFIPIGSPRENKRHKLSPERLVGDPMIFEPNSRLQRD